MRRAIMVFVCGLMCVQGPVWGARQKEPDQRTLEFMREEIERAKSTLASSDPDQILDDPYQVSALYYSDSFFAKLQEGTSRKKSKSAPTPQDEIVLAIKPLLLPEIENHYLGQLRELFADATDGGEGEVIVAPLDNYEFRKCSSRCHDDAIDLFTAEGSLVRTMASGVVVLAEDGWQPNRPLATVSQKGGNEVIVFNPETNRFYRYCHLDTVFVQTRDIIPAGMAIGTVGHSGKNASLKGHGQHLHLEINLYDPSTRSRSSVSRKALTQLLKKIKRS
jgi:murein DD-endopeptidase MepM/ murein hydrolase activator NlpD